MISIDLIKKERERFAVPVLLGGLTAPFYIPSLAAKGKLTLSTPILT